MVLGCPLDSNRHDHRYFKLLLLRSTRRAGTQDWRARASVIECKTESSQGSHSAPYPRALVEFFIKAFSDAGDTVLDCFMGSGTTMAAALALGRTGYGCEISPAYCDVIVRRMMNLGIDAMLESNGDSFADVAAARGVDLEQTLNPKAQDSGAIKHHGPNPHYGSRAKKAS